MKRDAKWRQVCVDPRRITAMTLAAAPAPAPAVIDRLDSRSAANQLDVAAAVDRQDRQTDGRTPDRYMYRRLPYTMRPAS